MSTSNGSATAMGTPGSGLAARSAKRTPDTATRRPRHGARVVAPRNPRAGHPTPAASITAEVMPRTHFVAQLRREMQRADRSRAPLSLVIYRLPGGAQAEEVATLTTLLALNKRETDILGDIGNGVLAVICTDTGDDGVHRFIAKIDELSADLPYSVESATYPDHLFEGLAVGPSTAHGPSPLFLHERSRPHRDAYLLKRPLDIVGALIALLVFSPVMLIAAVAVKFTSPGPVIFRQTRLGRGGRPFAFYKFRSMVVNNDDRIHREYVASLIKGEHAEVDQSAGESDVMRFKIKADPRITWVGRIIRKTSIDELPQLFNVLKGDMSLVGPRPPLPYEAENYQSWHLRRVLDIRPGITGLWQVEGRSRVAFDEMVRMDLRYIRSCSLGLDLHLLAKTALVVFRCDGAA